MSGKSARDVEGQQSSLKIQPRGLKGKLGVWRAVQRYDGLAGGPERGSVG